MTDVARVLLELDRLEHIQADLAAIASRTDGQRKNDMIDLRRDLSRQIALLGEIVEPLLIDPVQRFEFRRRFSAMRSTTAMHQADWSAIRLGEDPGRYLQSATGVRDNNRALITWVREVLGKQVSPP